MSRRPQTVRMQPDNRLGPLWRLLEILAAKSGRYSLEDRMHNQFKNSTFDVAGLKMRFTDGDIEFFEKEAK